MESQVVIDQVKAYWCDVPDSFRDGFLDALKVSMKLPSNEDIQKLIEELKNPIYSQSTHCS